MPRLNDDLLAGKAVCVDRAALPTGRLGQVYGIADFVLSGPSGVVTGSVIDRDQAIPGARDWSRTPTGEMSPCVSASSA